jgi:hypothetical protein
MADSLGRPFVYGSFAYCEGKLVCLMWIEPQFLLIIESSVFFQTTTVFSINDSVGLEQSLLLQLCIKSYV